MCTNINFVKWKLVYKLKFTNNRRSSSRGLLMLSGFAIKAPAISQSFIVGFHSNLAQTCEDNHF